MAPRKSARGQDTVATPTPHDLSHDGRRKSLGAMAHRCIDQAGLDLAKAWGVMPGSEAWVEKMTAYSIVETMQRNFSLPTRSSISPLTGQSLNTLAAVPPNTNHKRKREVGVQEEPLTHRKDRSNSTAISPLASVQPSCNLDIRPADPGMPAISTTLHPRRSTRQKPATAVVVVTAAMTTPSARQRTRQQSVASTARGLDRLAPDLDIDSTGTAANKDGEKRDGRPFKCLHFNCQWSIKGFSRQEHLHRHISSVHDKAITHVCDSCGAGFTRKDNWQQHVRWCTLAN